MMRYDFLARLRQQEMLRDAEKGRLHKAVSEARRLNPARPEPRREFTSQRA